jgi:holo-[acyl-carrier protein] synthase
MRHASRWAVKEAAYKALYPIRPTWKEVTYSSFNAITHAKPTLIYHPVRDNVTPAHKLHVSASHDGDYIFAQVIAELT